MKLECVWLFICPIQIVAQLLLSHLNWLNGFNQCFNFVFVFQEINLSLLNHNVPFIHYNDFSSNLYLFFGNWTNCVTVSFVMPHWTNGQSLEISTKLVDVYRNLDFEFAKDCLQFGQFCSLNTVYGVLKSPRRKPIAVFSLNILYVIPEFFIVKDEYQKIFSGFDFDTIFENPFLQTPYKVVYPIVQRSNSEYEFAHSCKKIVIMCKFCNEMREYYQYTSHWLRAGYPFKGFPIDCNFLNIENRQKLKELYQNVTQDGNNLTYNKLNGFYVDG